MIPLILRTNYEGYYLAIICQSMALVSLSPDMDVTFPPLPVRPSCPGPSLVYLCGGMVDGGRGARRSVSAPGFYTRHVLLISVTGGGISSST